MENLDVFYAEMPKQENLENFKRSAEQTFEAHTKASEYRMQNYLNCVDDYSWGGICDQAQNQESSFLTRAISLLQEQLDNGTAFINEFSVNVLMDMEGNIVSERLVNTRYGSAWLVETEGNVSFVSTSKKQATYNKKGYQLGERVYKVEYYYTTKRSKNGLISRGRVLEIQTRVVDTIIPNSTTTRLPEVAYFALNN